MIAVLLCWAINCLHHSMTSIKPAHWYSGNWIPPLIIAIIGLLVYHQVFTADLFYLDEAWELWHRTSDANYRVFASSGRLLNGVVFQNIITSIDKVADLKYLRIGALAGWLICAWMIYYFACNWVQRLNLSSFLPFLLGLFCICSSSVSIQIGWASCAPFLIAFILGLLAAHWLFLLLWNNDKLTVGFILQMIGVLVLTVCSLLSYQSMVGIFVLPFLLWWVSPNGMPAKKMTIAVSLHLFSYVIYFLVFQYYIKALNYPITDRAEITFNILKKIGFFFSTPFSQAWSLNHLVNAHNIISQLFPMLLFFVWLILYHRQNRKRIGRTAVGLIIVLFLLGVSYLPSIASSINYSPYRTMAALNLCAGALFANAVLNELKSSRQQYILTGLWTAFILFFAYTNFNTRFINLQRKEYSALQQQPFWNNIDASDTVVFIRADAKIFKALYGITSYKDEYGAPSTSRDWTPDFLMRQMIYERKGMETANKMAIYQFSDSAAYADTSGRLKGQVIVDMNRILREQKLKEK